MRHNRILMAALALAGVAQAQELEGTCFESTPIYNATGSLQSGFGETVTTVGDLDGDGLDEVAFVAPNVNSERGSVRIWFPGDNRTVTVSGPSEGKGFGYDIAPAGDINGDGFDDLAISCTQWRIVPIEFGVENQAAVLIWYGGPDVLLADTSADESDARIEGQLSRFSGSAPVAGAGDIDDDGFADLVISHSVFGFGQVYVFYGAASRIGILTFQDADWHARGDIGHDVAGVGDVNGDGYDDLASSVGTLFLGSHAGQVSLWYGSSTGLGDPADEPDWTSRGRETEDEHFGRSLERAGDVNGDGYADFAVAAPGAGGGRGRVFVWYGGPNGPTPGDVTMADWVFTGDFNVSQCGTGLAPAGDIDGDGYADLVVGCPEPPYGRASVFRGGPNGLLDEPCATITSGFLSAAGQSVATAGDVTGDGRPDLVVGAPSYSEQIGGSNGQATVWAAKPLAPTFTPAQSFGATVSRRAAFVGDVNGDGYADFSHITTIAASRAALYLGGPPSAPPPLVATRNRR